MRAIRQVPNESCVGRVDTALQLLHVARVHSQLIEQTFHRSSDTSRVRSLAVIPDCIGALHGRCRGEKSRRHRVYIEVKMTERVAQRSPASLGGDLEPERRAAPRADVARTAFGQAPQAAPNAGGRTTLQQHATLGVLDQEHLYRAGRQGLACGRARIVFGIARGARGAIGAQRTTRAIGFAAAAERGAEIHDRLRVIRDARARRVVVGERPKLLLDRASLERRVDRYHAIDAPLKGSAIEQQLWALADHHTPRARVADYTQAIMDLGATLCRRGEPDCPRCPLRADCAARAAGNPEDYPRTTARKTLPTRAVQMLLIQDAKGRVLLQRRPPTGIWGGLWSLPECRARDIRAWSRSTLGLEIAPERSWAPLRHTFSHFHLDIHPVPARLLSATAAMESADTVWYNCQRPDARGVAAPVKRLLDQLRMNSGDVQKLKSRIHTADTLCIGKLSNGAHGEGRKTRPRSGRPRLSDLPGRAGETELGKLFQRGVEALAESSDHADEQISLESARSQGTQVHRDGDGEVLLRHGREAARRLRSA